jgi:hypothetical protein
MGYSAVMTSAADSTGPGGDQQRVLRQLDRMVAAGRVTAQEAERLRGAPDAAAFEAVMGEIRARHAGADLDAAVAAGQLTRAEADDLQHRIGQGDHPRGLRGQLRRWAGHRRPPGGHQSPEGHQPPESR